MTHHVFVFLEIFAQEGGIQSYVKDLFRAYAILIQENPALRSQIFLLRDEPGCDNPFATERLEFTYLKTTPAWQGRIKLAFALGHSLLNHRPQQVFCGHINLAPLIRFYCRLWGLSYTVLTYGKEVWQPLAPSQRQALQDASAIWTISRYSRDRLCAAHGIAPDHVSILPCIVDGEQFTPAPKPPSLIEQYGLQDALVLMTVARLWSGDIYKGVDVTLRALPRILRSFPQVKYLIIGRGDDRPRLEQLALELDVADRVVFAGFVAHEALVDHYRVADAYIMPSQEGFGIVYLEALACGIPVLSGDADGSADPLQDGKLGWRVPHRDPDAVAQACVEMLTHAQATRQAVCQTVVSPAVSQDRDRRVDGSWLREQTLANFSPEALRHQLEQWVNLPQVNEP